MNKMPQHVLRALEALAQSPINSSALAMAEAKDLSHDTLPFYFSLTFQRCKTLGGLQGGFLIIDDVLIQRYRSGKMGLQRLKDTSTGSYVFGFSLVVLAWTDGKRRLPLAFLPYFADEGTRLELALALLSWAKEEGFQPEAVLFDAWYAAKEVLEWLHAAGWPLVTRLRSNRLLDGVGFIAPPHPLFSITTLASTGRAARWSSMGRCSPRPPTLSPLCRSTFR